MSNFKIEKKNKNFSRSETILLVIITFIVGMSIGFLLNKKNVIMNESSIKDKYIKEFAKNYEFIINNYYEDVDKESLINSAIEGMLNSLDDPYSMYFSEEEKNNFSITLNGSYKGIGIQISKDNETGYMTITAIFKNSPAFSAGLKVGDKIVSIDDNESKNMTSSDFSKVISDSDKDEFLLKIIRNDEELEITLKKSVITLNSVTSEIYEQPNKKIGYIYIGIFANNTYSQFKEELDKLEKQKIDYLIIDVRGNTGGHLTSVESILDLFLNEKQIMYQFEQDGKITSTYGSGHDNKSYKIVVLCDEVSASASEVLIAGIRENLDSVVIGKKTYGKGTVQELVTLSNGTQYKITIKKWLTPTGKWVNDTEGIIPDIEVDLSDKYYETYESSDDDQLMKALDFINNN